MNELIRLTATEAVARLKAGDLTPMELIDAAEARHAEVDGAVNAMPTVCFDRARDHAKRLTVPDDPDPGHLYGLPVAIKDLSEVKGVRTTFGSMVYADNIPQRSDIMVERIEERGGLVVGKANTPEFGAGAQTFNEVFGVTRNPYDIAKTPGGSSGGSAVVVATGQTWLAQGSDLGGSLRIPAAFAGCVGLRPSPGRVPYGPGKLPFAPNGVQGPMARTVADTALFLDTLCGFQPKDPISLPKPHRTYQQAVKDARPPKKVAFSMDMGISPIHPAIRDSIDKSLQHFRDMGAEIVESKVDFSCAEPVFQTLRAAQFAAAYQPVLETDRDKLKPEVIWNIEKGLALTAADIGQAERTRADLFQRFQAQFDDIDIFVTPCTNTPPFSTELRYLEELEGKTFDSYISWLIMTFAITITTCPAISVPCGLTPDGLPVGLQIVGPQRRDDIVLAAGEMFEQATGRAFTLPVDPRGTAG